jgi:phenylalanyl-tRNA synthetase alpha chain
MSVRLLTPAEVSRALAVRDLTDPVEGPHALQRLVDDAVGALRASWRCDVRVWRGPRIVPVADNYDALGYDASAVTRDARYTKYVTPATMLRSHTSALIPSALRSLRGTPSDLLIACPGVVHRRDAIDRVHSGAPHQLDLWRVSATRHLYEGDLKEMVEIVVRTLLPGAEYRVEPRDHPYTTGGLQIDVGNGDEWVEIGECGVAARHVIDACGHGGATGLAMGLGLDRILMLRKGVADIRLLRSDDPRVARQMRDLSLYRPTSNHPPVARDLSIAIDRDDTAEDLGDRVRDALGDDADCVEAVEIVSRTPAHEVPAAARERIGLGLHQHNVLVRVVLRHPSRTLTRDEANELRDRVYGAVHRGSAALWAARSSAS